ncbi:cytochrome P450 [Epithele typhae]|uniref:cytochrome P450 n=1 Tax=Epithele typhae TaxID=378194 RepID=UPI002008CBBF|nr:cytochrome P450 [Epithele typhae]KAH9941609.1 cytochrome P450 [Epithele typhae]
MIGWRLVPALLCAPLALLLYFLSAFLSLLVRQARSPLRHLPGPSSPSFFLGNLREMHDQENNNLVARWTAAFGSTFVYRGFLGGRRLMTVDPLAVNHIMSRGYDYPKPDFVRDSLASMTGGYEGLLTADGDMHRKQNPAFSAAQIKSMTPVFWDKATRLRDVWLEIVTSQQSFTPADPLTLHEPVADARKRDPEPATAPVLSPSALTTSFLPNPFSSFVPSKASPTLPSSYRSRRNRRRGESTASSPLSPNGAASPLDDPEEKEQEKARIPEDGIRTSSRIDVLPWLARATLDVIGEAGFGYHFGALESAAERRGDESELARAYGVIFGTARKFRVMTILQVWFPFLRHFRRENSATQQATEVTRKIGLELIEQRRSAIAAEELSEKADAIEGDKTALDRDLLSVLIRSNISQEPSKQMSINEILNQISTFLAAGHETSSSALTWMLFALGRHPEVQKRLREELRSVDLPSPFSPSPGSLSASTSPSVSPSTPSSSHPSSPCLSSAFSSTHHIPTPTPELLDRLVHLPYLDAVVREGLRLYAPITTTMRVATAPDAVPLATPIVDARGRACTSIAVAPGDIISVPIQAMNTLGSRGDESEFMPERWLRAGADAEGERRKGVQGLWANMLTFGGGNPVNGNRSCIGYRFALSEIKVFLYVLVRDLEFSADPAVEIEKKVNVVTRPCVKSEPERGNQMPLYVRQASPPSERTPAL